MGFDIVPYSAKADLEKMFQELLDMNSQKERVPDDGEFPLVRPQVDSYELPTHLIDWTGLPTKAEGIRKQLRDGIKSGPLLGPMSVPKRRPAMSPKVYYMRRITAWLWPGKHGLISLFKIIDMLKNSLRELRLAMEAGTWETRIPAKS